MKNWDEDEENTTKFGTQPILHQIWKKKNIICIFVGFDLTKLFKENLC